MLVNSRRTHVSLPGYQGGGGGGGGGSPREDGQVVISDQFLSSLFSEKVLWYRVSCY